MVAKRKEGNKTVERFIKIPENDTKKLLTPFQRQIEVVNYIKEKGIMNTRGIVVFNYNPNKGIPFVVMETLPAGHSKIGFIEGNKSVELLGAKEAERTIDQLKKFHSISIKSLQSNLKKILKTYLGDYKSFKQEVFRYLNKKVKALDGKGKSESFYTVLEHRLVINDLKNKTKELLEQLEPIIDAKENRESSIVHGDMAPNNLYVFDSGDVELLDLEWVGTFKNKAIAMILDFGNLRARSWGNKKFREALDSALIKAYCLKGKENLGKVIVKLSILRSLIHLSGFFENYDQAKQKDKIQTRRRNSTEQDLVQIFKK